MPTISIYITCLHGRDFLLIFIVRIHVAYYHVLLYYPLTYLWIGYTLKIQTQSSHPMLLLLWGPYAICRQCGFHVFVSSLKSAARGSIQTQGWTLPWAAFWLYVWKKSRPLSDVGSDEPLRCPRCRQLLPALVWCDIFCGRFGSCRCYANPHFKWSLKENRKLLDCTLSTEKLPFEAIWQCFSP